MATLTSLLSDISPGMIRIVQIMPDGSAEICDDFPEDDVTLVRRHLGYFDSGFNSGYDCLEGHHAAFNHTGQRIA